MRECGDIYLSKQIYVCEIKYVPKPLRTAPNPHGHGSGIYEGYSQSTCLFLLQPSICVI